MKALYPAQITYDPKDGRYLVQFPDLEEAVTEGVTLEEVLYNAAEVLTLTLEGRGDEGIKVPLPISAKDAYLIAPLARQELC